MASGAPATAPTAPGQPGAAPVVALPNNGGAPSGAAPAQTAAQRDAAETDAGLNSTQKAQVAAGIPSGQPALLVSSASSRAATGSNVNAYNAAATAATPTGTTPVTPSVTNPPTTGTQTPATGSDTPNPGSGGGGTGANPNPGAGSSNAPNTPNTSGNGNSGAPVITTVTFSDGSSGQYNQTTGQMTDMNGNTLTWNGTGWVNPIAPGTPMTATGNGPAVQPSTPTPSTTGAATYGVTTAGQNAYSAAIASGMPASLAQSYADNIDNLSQEETQAKATLAQAAATLQNDPVATQAIAAISSKYDTLISAMTASNTQALGRAATSVAAFGGLGVMNLTFMSDEMDAANSRIAALTSEQSSAMLSAQAAYAKQDLAAFNSAMTDYKDSVSSMTTAINDLNNATDKQVTQTQNATKIANAASKQQLASDISNSTKLAAGIVSQLQGAGITDASQISEEDIQGIADANGISDPSLLYSAVVAQFATNAKANASLANTASEISTRTQTTADTNAKTNATLALDNLKLQGGGTIKGGTDGTFTYTGAQLQTAAGILDSGGTIDGVTYNGRGADGYVDPGAYVAIYHSWVGSGGTPKGFASKFPVKSNVNPASYSQLPTVLQPTAAAAAAPIPQ